MDCRFVTKWKRVKIKGVLKRIIRQRLTLRGFKDREKDELQRFAGTAQRQSQLMLSSITAANPDCVDWCTDISKAFLQGLSFKELHELTGEPMRNVSFVLPLWASKVLRQLEGFEDFDPATECLECLKPGTGCVDAPRAFSLKLSRTLRACEMKPTLADDQLEVCHHEGRLNLAMTKHVDDLRFTGQEAKATQVVNKLQEGSLATSTSRRTSTPTAELNTRD